MCQWDQPPAKYGPESTVHGWFQRSAEGGVFEIIWAAVVAECDELGGVRCKWQAADGMLGKARSGGKKAGSNLTDRGKPGTEKSLIVECDGGPLEVEAAANVPDCQFREATVEAVVIERPGTEGAEQHPCLDAGYDNTRGRAAVEKGEYVGHIRPQRPAAATSGRAGRSRGVGWWSGRWAG